MDRYIQGFQCMCTSACLHVCTSFFVSLYAPLSVCVSVCMRTCLCVCAHVLMHVCTRCEHMHECILYCSRMHMCTCAHACPNEHKYCSIPESDTSQILTRDSQHRQAIPLSCHLSIFSTPSCSTTHVRLMRWP